MKNKYDKIFVIGFNKTATLTFHHLFLKNGLKSQHNNIWDTEIFDCFSDNGDFHDFKKLDQKYNGFFILNTRHINKWMISRFKHGLRKRKEWGYPCSTKKCETWIRQRENHFHKILEYFVQFPEKLIIVNIEKPGWEKFVSKKLNFKHKEINSYNVFETKLDYSAHREIIKIVNNTLDKLEIDQDNLLLYDKQTEKKYLSIYDHYI